VAPQTRGLLLTAAAEPVGDLTLIGPIEAAAFLDADIRVARRRATAGAIASASKEQRVRSSHAGWIDVPYGGVPGAHR
jgi:hypothetical protein